MGSSAFLGLPSNNDFNSYIEKWFSISNIARCISKNRLDNLRFKRAALGWVLSISDDYEFQ